MRKQELVPIGSGMADVNVPEELLRHASLSQGIVCGYRETCPLQNWSLGLETGAACASDDGCVGRFATRVEDSRIWLDI